MPLVLVVFMPLACLTFFDSFVDADFICDGSSACSYRSANQRALASAQQCACNCAACRGAANNLCSGMVPMIMCRLCVLRAFMTFRLCLLRKARGWESKYAEQRERKHCLFQYHPVSCSCGLDAELASFVGVKKKQHLRSVRRKGILKSKMTTFSSRFWFTFRYWHTVAASAE
jgi:hypothetical protein